MKARLLTCLSLATGAATAQQEIPSYPMPESPAAAAIGTADATILKPSTAKDLAASLARVASRGGKITSGISLEFAPATLFRGSRFVDLEGGRAGKIPFGVDTSLGWMLANTTVSLATGAKEGTGSSADKIALGLKIPLYDKADVRQALLGCYKDLRTAYRAKSTADEAPQRLASAGTVAMSEVIKEPREYAANERANMAKALERPFADTCFRAESLPAWNSGAAAIAFAQVWTDLGTADRAQLTRDAQYTWLSFATSLKDKDPTRSDEMGMQLTMQARLARNIIDTTQSVAAGAQPIRYRGESGAFRFKLGEEKLNADLAGSVERRRYSDGKSENVRLLSLGLEFLVGEKTWLKLSMGAERKSSTGNTPFVNTSFKWGSDSKPTPQQMEKALIN